MSGSAERDDDVASYKITLGFVVIIIITKLNTRYNMQNTTECY